MTDRLILTVAILGGTGNLGPGLALRWASAGYRVIVGSRQEEKAREIASELNERLGVEGVEGMENVDAARNADICVLTVKAEAHEPMVKRLRDVLNGKILVDTTARVDFRDPQPPPAPSASRMAQETLGESARVVAAFQTIPAHELTENPGGKLDLDVLVCADDMRAAEEVIKLIEGAGMRAFYAGDLNHAVVVEGLTSLLMVMNKRYKSKQGAVKVVGIEP